MKVLFVFLFLSVSWFASGQKGRYYGEPADASLLCVKKIEQSNSFSSNASADTALNKILNVTGLAKNFYLKRCDGISNCEAHTFNGDRYILYDSDFMKFIAVNSDSWSNLSILAHEIGHHVNGHTLKGNTSYAQMRQEEIEADEYSGFVLYKLGATLKQAQAAINKFGSDGDDTYSTHPSKLKRLKAIEKGYKRAMSATKDIPIGKKRIVKTYHKNGRLHRKTTYVGDLKEGLHQEFFDNGKLGEEGYFHLDLRHGYWEAWYPNGAKCYERSYRNGKNHGKLTIWNPYKNGVIGQIVHYENGIEISKKCFDEDGNVVKCN